MILAIDTSTQWMGLALLDDDQIIYEKTWKTNRRHTVELSPAIQAALQDTGTDAKTIDAVAVAIGPGSFTSLRIGLAAAKGFALALHVPIIGVPSLDVTAAGVPVSENDLVCLLRAGRGRLAAMRYKINEDHWESEGDYFVVTAEELEQQITSRTIICGEMTPDEKKILSRRWRNTILIDPPANIRRPAVLAHIGSARHAQSDHDDSATIAPIYLRTVKNIDN